MNKRKLIMTHMFYLMLSCNGLLHASLEHLAKYESLESVEQIKKLSNGQSLFEVTIAAIEGNKIDNLKLLIEAKADVTTNDKYEYLNGAPLHLAAKKGDLEMVKLLVGAKATLDTRLGMYHWNPIDNALNSNCVPVVKFLIDSKVQVENEMLHHATHSNNRELIKFFLDLKIPVDCRSIDKFNNNTTPLLEAADYCLFESIQELLKNNANIHLVNKYNMNSLLLLVRAVRQSNWNPTKEMPSAFKMLVEYGCDIHIKEESFEYSTLDWILNYNNKNFCENNDEILSLQKELSSILFNHEKCLADLVCGEIKCSVPLAKLIIKYFFDLEILDKHRI